MWCVCAAWLLLGAVAVTWFASPARAVDVGTLEARMRDQLGYTSPDARTGRTGGNCITYSPRADATSSAWVGAGREARTGHGTARRSCPAALDIDEQSVIGFAPGPGGDLPLGDVASVGTITHYNNPVTITDNHYRGLIEVRTSDLIDANGDPVVFSFPWYMWETPNNSAMPDDYTEITVQSPETVVYISDGRGGRRPYRMVVAGFAPDDAACARGEYQNEWWTPEGRRTSASMCAQLTQVRTLEVVKTVDLPEGFTGTVPAFDFDATSRMTNLDGVDTFWDEPFALRPEAAAGQSPTATTGARDALVPNQSVTITEAEQPGWRLAAAPVCTGAGVDVRATGNAVTVTAREVATEDELPIVCTFTNTPRLDPLVVTKSVSDPAYEQDYAWDIAKTVSPDGTNPDDPRESGTRFDYTVTVTPTALPRRDGTYTTRITVTNPNDFTVTGVRVVDEQCAAPEAPGGTVWSGVLTAREERAVTLDCAAPPDADLGEPVTNTAVVSWADPVAGRSQVTARADVDFTGAEVVDGDLAQVSVTDTFAAFAQKYPDVTLRGADGPATFAYSVVHAVTDPDRPGACEVFTNTATIVETGQRASTDAKVCDPTAAITVQKLGAHCDVDQPTCLLPGAAFAVFDADPATGDARLVGELTAGRDGATFTSGDLSLNTDYWLVETAAPAGMELLPAAIGFRITAEDGIVLADAPGVAAAVSVTGDDHLTLRIVDQRSGDLPEAGGSGHGRSVAAGSALLGAAAVLCVLLGRRRTA